MVERLTDEQSAPTPERAELPAVWDVVMADVARYDVLQESADVSADEDQMYGVVLGMLPLVARHLGTDLLADMRERDAAGRQRYGTPLQPHNGRRALVDAYQELLDAAVYLRQHLYERDGR